MQLINTDVKMHMACPGFVNTTMIRRAQKEAVGPAQWPAKLLHVHHATSLRASSLQIRTSRAFL